MAVIGTRTFPPYSINLFFGVSVAPDNFGTTVHAPEYRDSSFRLYHVTETTKNNFMCIKLFFVVSVM